MGRCTKHTSLNNTEPSRPREVSEMEDRKYTTAAERERARDELLRGIREDLDTLMILLNMRAPDFAPVECDPWDDAFEEAVS